MQTKTEGIVLRVTKYGDTSIISQCFTRELGVKSYLIKGVRHIKNRNKANCFTPGNILEMDVMHRPHRELHFIKEYRLIHYFHSHGFDVLKSAILMFIMEVLNKTLKEETPNEKLFDALKVALLQLAKQSHTDPNFHLFFLIHLSAHLGFMPEKNFSGTLKNSFDLKAGSFDTQINIQEIYRIDLPLSHLFYKLLCFDKNLMLTTLQRTILLEKILFYFHLHLPNFHAIKSPQILHEILAD